MMLVIDRFRDMPVEQHIHATKIAQACAGLAILGTAGMLAGPGFIAALAVGALSSRLLPSGMKNRLLDWASEHLCGDLFKQVEPLPDDDRLSIMMREIVPAGYPLPPVYQTRQPGFIAAARNIDPHSERYVVLVDKNVTDHLPDPDVRFILAHEYSHILKQDPDATFGRLLGWGVMLCGLVHGSIHAVTAHNPALVMGIIAGSWVMERCVDMELRSKERRADLGAMDLTQNPEAGIAMLARTAFIHTVVTKELTEKAKAKFNLTEEWINHMVRHPGPGVNNDETNKNLQKIVDLLAYNQGRLWRERPLMMLGRQMGHFASARHPKELERIHHMQQWKKRRDIESCRNGKEGCAQHHSPLA